MTHLSNINWTSLLSNDDGKYFLAVIGFVAVILLVGFVELLLYRQTLPGLTTWAFAVPGVIAVVVIVAADSGIHLLLRLLLIVVWCAVVVGAFRLAYIFTQTRWREHPQD